MRRRTSSVLLTALTFGAGLIAGGVLCRTGPTLLGQAANITRTAVGANRAESRKQADDEIYETLARQFTQFQQVNRTFELVARAVSPTVVHIIAHKTARNDETRRTRQFEETGSGVIVRSARAQGLYVLTNHHVVDGAKPAKIRIYLQDGRTLRPTRILQDSEGDIAVLALDRDDLPAARMGDSDALAVGEWVLALGSPFGLTHSVSQGIISALGRHMEELKEVKNQDFLQTDAAINPGNSGGPLVNLKGEVIGINNSIASNGGGNEGVGFSIPIKLARWIMDELLAHGRVIRGALGVDLHSEFREEEAVALGLERPRGALIDKVHAGSPAALAGIRDGDVVLRYAGAEIEDLNELINRVSMSPVGSAAEIVIWRDRHEQKLRVKVGEREQMFPESDHPREPAAQPGQEGLVRRPDRPKATASFALGLELATLDAERARQIQLPEGMKGALVVRVDESSPLANVARPNDVIAAIDDTAIQSAEQAVKLLNQHDEHAQAVIRLDRLVGGEIEQHTVRVP